MGGTSRNNVCIRYDSKYDGSSTHKKPCHKCGKDFKHNDLVYVKKGKKGKTNIYHLLCWKSLLQ